MKKVINKKILPWLLFSCLSYLPIAAACSSNQATKVVNQQSDKTNQPSTMNGLFGMGDETKKAEQPSTNPLANMKDTSEGEINTLNTTNSDGVDANEPSHHQTMQLQPNSDISHSTDQSASAADHHQSTPNQENISQSGATEDDQADVDSTNLSPTKFPDLQNLTKEISAENSPYHHLFPKVALSQIKNKFDEVLKLFQAVNHINSKYKMTIQYDGMTFPDQINGRIRDLIINFQLGNKYEEFRFNLTNLKQQPISLEMQQQHSEYLSKKTHLDERLTALFPSFLATMLYYAENIPTTPHIESKQLKLDYYSFLNDNKDLLRLDGIHINKSLLSQLFNYKNTENEYVTKVVGIKFDDLNGTLGLKIRISPAEGNNYDNSEYEEEFEFDGFRQLKLHQPEANVLSFVLPTASFTKIVHANSDIQTLLKQHQNTNQPVDLIAALQQENSGSSKANFLFHKIEQNLVWNIDDDTNAIYYSTYPDNSLRLSALRAIQRNFGVYPFYTNYSFNELFDHLSLKLEPDQGAQESKLTLSFQVRLPVFVIDYYSTINDLHSSVNQYLVLPVSSTIALADALKPA